MKKMGKLATWLLAAAGIIYGIRRYRFHKRASDERERRIEAGLNEVGLTKKDAEEIRMSNKPGTLKLVEILRKCVTWDLSDSWKGTDDFIKDNMILVSQERSKSGKLDWTIKIKVPGFKPSTPIMPDYMEQIEELMKQELGIIGFNIRKKYYGLYVNSDNIAIDGDGNEVSDLLCFPIIASDLDSFKNPDGSGNGLEGMFKLLQAEKFGELEEKLGMGKEMCLQDLEMYLEISTPVSVDERTLGLDLIGIQNLLKEILAFQVTSSRSGGRYAQVLGPVAFCSDMKDPNREITSFWVWSKENSVYVEKKLKVVGRE